MIDFIILFLCGFFGGVGILATASVVRSNYGHFQADLYKTVMLSLLNGFAVGLYKSDAMLGLMVGVGSMIVFSIFNIIRLVISPPTEEIRRQMLKDSMVDDYINIHYQLKIMEDLGGGDTERAKELRELLDKTWKVLDEKHHKMIERRLKDKIS